LERISIVVPFANLSGDPEQDYFVDGVTESLTTDLSRIRGSFVIGRHLKITRNPEFGCACQTLRMSFRDVEKLLIGRWLLITARDFHI
jgi:TolB-like protein